jgi:hypothetical protein
MNLLEILTEKNAHFIMAKDSVNTSFPATRVGLVALGFSFKYAGLNESPLNRSILFSVYYIPSQSPHKLLSLLSKTGTAYNYTTAKNIYLVPLYAKDHPIKNRKQITLH